MPFRPISDAQVIEERPRPAGGRGFRPIIENADQSVSTERTIGIESEGRHLNIPTIVRGQQLDPDAAIAEWAAGRNPEVGVFPTRQEADTAAAARSTAIGEAIRTANVPRGTMPPLTSPQDVAAVHRARARTPLPELVRTVEDARAINAVPEPIGPPAMRVGPAGPPIGAGSISTELPGAVRRAFAEPALGVIEFGADVLGAPAVSERAAAAARDLHRQSAISRARLPTPSRDVTPSVLDRAATAVSEPQNIMEAVTQTIQLLPGLAGAAYTKSAIPALASMRAITAGPEYQRYKDMGHTPFWSAVGAIMQAESEAQPEKLALNYVLTKPIGRLLRGTPREMAQAARFVGTTAGLEMGSEGISTTLNWLTDVAMRDPGATPARLAEDLKQTMAQMAVQGPLMAGVARAGRAAPEMVGAIRDRIESPAASVGREMARAVAETELPPATPLAAYGAGRVLKDPATMTGIEINKELDILERAPTPDRERLNALYAEMAERPGVTGKRIMGEGYMPRREATVFGGGPDYYEPFKKATGKYPWDMTFAEFFKHTVSKLKSAEPGQPARWYERVIRGEWDKAREQRALGHYGTGGGVEAAARDFLDIAAQHQPDFEGIVRSIADRLDLGAVVAPVKSLARTLEKVIADYRGDVTQLKDANRATLLVNSPAEIGRVLSEVNQVGQPVKVRNLYQGVELGRGDAYRDATSVLKLPWGSVEIQVNTPEMFEAKNRAHILYEWQSAIARRAATEGREFTTEERDIMRQLDARMRDIYQGASVVNNRRVSLGQNYTRQELDDIAKRSFDDVQSFRSAEAARFADMLSKVGLSIGVSEEGLGQRAMRRGGEESNAITTPVSRSTETGVPSKSQYSSGTEAIVAKEGEDAVQTTGSDTRAEQPFTGAAARDTGETEAGGREGDRPFLGTRGSRADREAGKSPANPIASVEDAVRIDRKFPPSKRRLGQCHTLTWRKVMEHRRDEGEEDLRHVIGVTQSGGSLPLGARLPLKIWHSVALDPETGSVWEPIADRWYAANVMTKAFGFEPVVSLSAEETFDLAAKSRVYTDQTVITPKLRGADSNFLEKGDYDPDPSIFEKKPVEPLGVATKGFYSPSREAIAALPKTERMTAAQWDRRLANLMGVKQSEIQLNGLLDWLATQTRAGGAEAAKKIPVEAILDYFDDNKIRFKREFKDEEESFGASDDDLSERAWQLWSDHLDREISREMPDRPTFEIEERAPGLFGPEPVVARIRLETAGAVEDFARGREDSARRRKGKYYWNFHEDNDLEWEGNTTVNDEGYGYGMSTVIGPFESAEIAREQAERLINKLWDDEYELRYDYASQDGAPDWAYEEAQRELGAAGPSGYRQYTQPGGRDYTEGFVTYEGPGGFEWHDGHEVYKAVRNPIARIRYTVRNDRDGREILFIEEVQPPTARNFAMMPKALQTNWKEIAVKTAINQAVKEGYEGVAWASGAQIQTMWSQPADKVRSVRWLTVEDAPRRASDEQPKAPDRLARIVELDTLDRGVIKIEGTPEEITHVPQSRMMGIIGHPWGDLFGEEIGKKIAGEPHGSVSGADLKAAFGKLGRLYDVVWPNAVKDVLRRVDKTGETKIQDLKFSRFTEHDEATRLLDTGSSLSDPEESLPRKYGIQLQQGFIISDALRQAVVSKGQPMMTRGAKIIYGPAPKKLPPGAFERMGLMTTHPRALRMTSPFELRYINELDETLRQIVAEAAAATGLDPAILAAPRAYVSYHPAFSQHKALFWPGVEVIGVRADILIEARQNPRLHGEMVNWIAHELTHMVDAGGSEKLGSQISPRLAMRVGPNGEILTIGDLAIEAGNAWRTGGPFAPLQLYLGYPFFDMAAGAMGVEIGASELVAQIGALYLARPETVRQYMPRWFKVMEATYGSKEGQGTAPKSIREAHARLQRALQDQGAKLGFEGIVPGYETRRRAALGTGSPRGPPRPAVGGGTRSGAPDPDRASAAGAPQRRGERPRLGVGGERPAPTRVEKYAGNTNLRRLSRLPIGDVKFEDIVDLYNRSVDLTGTRSPRSHAATQAAADAARYTLTELLGREPGEAINAEQTKAARDLLMRLAADVKGYAIPAAKGDAIDIGRFAMMMHLLTAAHGKVAGMAAEAGRALNAYLILARASSHDIYDEPQQWPSLTKKPPGPQAEMEGQRGEPLTAQLAIEALGGFDNAMKVAADVAAGKSPIDIIGRARRRSAETVPPWWLEFWKAMLLTNPATHVVNFVGTGATTAFRPIEALTSAALSIGAAPEDKVFAREAIALVMGAVAGIKPALRAALETIKTGNTPYEKYDHQVSIPGRTGEAVRVPFRLMATGDAFWKAINYTMSLYQLAARETILEGLGAEGFNRLTVAPTTEARERAEADMDRYTYNKELGAKGRAFQNLVRQIPVLGLVFPFVRTPANIFKFAAERSPAAMIVKEWREDFKAGGRPRREALGRMVTGTALSMLTLMWASAGLITGGGPPDAERRRRLLEAGWQPYSFRVGNRYVSYRRIEPLGMLMGMAADLYEVYGALDREETEKLGKMLAYAFANNVTSKTFLQGISDAAKGLDPGNPNQFKFFESLAGSLVPAGVAGAARQVDPVMRDTRGFYAESENPIAREFGTVLARIQSRVPWWSKSLPAKRDIYGEAIERDDPGFISPFSVTRIKTDATRTEMAKIGARLKLPARTQGGHRLTNEEYSEYQQEAGARLREKLEAFFDSGRHEDLAPDEQRDAVSEIARQVRRDVTKALDFPLTPEEQARKDARRRGREAAR